jgi:hypothetical protein
MSHSFFKHALLFVLVCVIAASAAFLEIRDTKTQGQRWPGHITAMDVQTTIDGIYARNILTISIKDTFATSWVDSLEAVLNFDLPPNSVIDSMYLWIKGVPEPGYMKKAWAATVIFENIVQRRMDPALLKRTGTTDNYTIQIFPYRKKEERKFKICYTTLLSNTGNSFTLNIPLNISATSCLAVKTITAQTTILKTKKTLVSENHDASGTVSITEGDNNSTTVLFTDYNSIHATNLTITILNELFATTGCLVAISQGKNGEAYFTAVVNPGKMTAITNDVAQKKYLFIWNKVNLSEIVYENTEKKYYYRYSYYSDIPHDDLNDRNAIVSFVRNNLTEKDKFNIVINDGTVSLLYKTLQTADSKTVVDLERFLIDSLSTINKDFGCSSPLDAVEKAVESLSTEETATIVLIDNMEHGYYPGGYDTAFSSKTFERLKKSIPSAGKFIFCIAPAKKNIINATYDALRYAYPTTLVSCPQGTDLNKFFTAISDQMIGSFSPAALTFSSTPNQRFPFDILGPGLNQFNVKSTYIYHGKLLNDKELKVTFNGVYNGKSYEKTVIAPVTDHTVGWQVSNMWAATKANLILAKPNLSNAEKKEALDVSLIYRIISGQTALLALEKELVVQLKISDDLPTPNDTIIIGNNNNTTGLATTTLFSSPASVRSLRYENKTLQIRLANPVGSQTGVRITIYDLRGKKIVIFTGTLLAGTSLITHGGLNISNGLYVVHSLIGKQLIGSMLRITK